MNNINEAIKILNNGGIIIFSTDTALGIGCRMDNEKAVERLFRLRKRPEDQAVPVLVNSIEMAQKYLQPISEDVKNKLMKKHWPGGLTIILPCRKEKVSRFVRGGGDNLGVRISDNEQLLEIITKLGVPLLAPSANFSGEKTPYEMEDLNINLVKLVDFVLLDAGVDKNVNKKNQSSTVIDCSLRPWKISRQGTVKISEIRNQKSKIKDSEIILGIDTADNKKISITIEINGEKREINMENERGSQVVLPAIEKILKENNLSLRDISGIRVNSGPGSFTGLRVGVSIANTLAFVLKVPINEKELSLLEEPKY
jgi:L-threonylcarbamoyladenylate synthase